MTTMIIRYVPCFKIFIYDIRLGVNYKSAVPRNII